MFQEDRLEVEEIARRIAKEEIEKAIYTPGIQDISEIESDPSDSEPDDSEPSDSTDADE